MIDYINKNIESFEEMYKEEKKVMRERDGKEMHELMEQFYPFCRSITGEGVRDTLRMIQKIINLNIIETPTGTEVYDWIIPNEWRVNGAYLCYENGEKILDYKDSNLYLLNYSRPYQGIVNFDVLKEHLHTMEQYPDWIPYRTSYYTDNWGFCLSYNEFMNLDRKARYEVHIDTELFPGSLTYGEYVIKGKTSREILLSTYLCHPSLCNDNLSGVVLSTYLAKYLSDKKDELEYTYRFIFVPETIGAVTWLAKNENAQKNIDGGLVVTCVGDNNRFVYKKTRDGDSLIDKIAEKALKDYGMPYKTMDYYPGGSDERQYGSPGINLPIGSLTRGLYTTDTIPPRPYKEYHTSADNLDFVKAENLEESFEAYLRIIDYYEKNASYISKNMKCEPFLAKRNLALNIGSGNGVYMTDVAIRFIMCYSDGKHDLIDIANLARVQFDEIYNTAQLLEHAGLIERK